MSHISQMKSLIQTLNDASEKYYGNGDSLLSDAQWDEKYDELQSLEVESGVVLPDSPTHRVGVTTSNFQPHTHISRLWSMEKVTSQDALMAWFQRLEKWRNNINQQRETPLPPLQYAVELKLDGLTLNLTYRNGQLVQAATRGNGETGESILAQAKTVQDIPLTIPYTGLLEIQGECIMRLSTLSDYNKTASEPLKNARNAAAGALRNIDPKETAKRKLDAFFYQVGTIENADFNDVSGMLDFMQSNHFKTDAFCGYAHTPSEVIALINDIEEKRDSLDFLIDGAVVKLVDFETRSLLGFTEKHPKWAVAYKYAAEEDITTLLNVTWELGRTGKLTPLAHLSPVNIGGVRVQKATLNNMDDIQRKKVAINSMVRIRRSNDVIPEILGREGPSNANEIAIEMPTHCPSCGFPLEQNGVHIFCPNKEGCKPQCIARLTHFASRNAMDIESLSEKTIQQLYDICHLRTPSDLYDLTSDDLFKLDGFKAKRVNNLLLALEKSKDCTLDAFLFALGIGNVGRKTARDLANHFGSIDSLRKATADELIQINEIGEIVANSIIAFFNDEQQLSIVDKLLSHGISVHSTSTDTPPLLTGLTFVVTGTLPTLSRDEAESLISKYGGKTSSSVSKKTSYLLAGEKAGSKLAKATTLGVPVLTEELFFSMLDTNKSQL